MIIMRVKKKKKKVCDDGPRWGVISEKVSANRQRQTDNLKVDSDTMKETELHMYNDKMTYTHSTYALIDLK